MDRVAGTSKGAPFLTKSLSISITKRACFFFIITPDLEEMVIPKSKKLKLY